MMTSGDTTILVREFIDKTRGALLKESDEGFDTFYSKQCSS